MKKIVKLFAMFCMVFLCGIMSQTMTLSAASGTIISGPKSCYSWKAQTDEITIKLNCNWTADIYGYPGMLTISEFKGNSGKKGSGNAGTYKLTLNLSECREYSVTNGTISSGVCFRNANTGANLFGFEVKQQKKPVEPVSFTGGFKNAYNRYDTNDYYPVYNVYYDYLQSSDSFTFDADCAWTASLQGANGMVSFSGTTKSEISGGVGKKNQISFNISANETGYDRKSTIVITNPTTKAKLFGVNIIQDCHIEGSERPSVKPEKREYTVEYYQDSIVVTIDSNVTWQAITYSSWIHIDQPYGKSGKYTIRFDKNNGSTPRQDYLHFKIQQGGMNQWLGSISITQNPDYKAAPDISIGHTVWGKYTKSLMKTYTNVKSVHGVATIDCDLECCVTDAVLISFKQDNTEYHEVENINFMNVTLPSSKYNDCCSSVCKQGYGHTFMAFFEFNGTKDGKKWDAVPQLEIKTKYNGEDLIYRIRFINVIKKGGNDFRYGYPEKIVYPFGKDGKHEPSTESKLDYHPYVYEKCPLCTWTLYSLKSEVKEKMAKHRKEQHPGADLEYDIEDITITYVEIRYKILIYVYDPTKVI